MKTPALPLLSAFALAACSHPPVLAVDKAYIRLNAVPTRPAVAYFTIHGGTADMTLIDVSSDVSVKSEMHESMAAHGMAAMQPIHDVPVRAATDTAFAPGGKHVMLFDMNPGVKPGRKVPLTFTFANNQRLLATATVIAAGAPVPAE